MTNTQPQPTVASIDSSIAGPDAESHRLEMIEQLRQLPGSLVESIGERLDAILDADPVEPASLGDQKPERPYLFREFIQQKDLEDDPGGALAMWSMRIAPKLKENILNPLRVMQGHIPSDIKPLSDAPSATYMFHTVDRAIPSGTKKPDLDDLLTYQKLFLFPSSGELLYLAEVRQELILKDLTPPFNVAYFPKSIVVAVTTGKPLGNGNTNPQLLTELFYWNHRGNIYRVTSRGEKYQTAQDAGADTIHNYLVRLGFNLKGSFYNRHTKQKLCLRSFPGIASPD